ncbi:MAG: DUF362 domain-containing protein [Candidatus Verstraetearchaeota archaeon]|nr:DUF362 domain-containing protein [Candidatus Verstraetearchaeota archaeon]
MKSRVIIVEGEDITNRTLNALKHLKPEIPKSEGRILIKPNLVEPMGKDSGAVTRPETVEGVIRFLMEMGDYEIIVGEGSAYPDTMQCFKIAGYEYLTEKYNVRLMDLNHGNYIKVNGEYWSFEVNNVLSEVDYIISVAVLKEHGFAEVTLTLKNMMGILKPAPKIPVKEYIHAEGDPDIWALRLCDLVKAFKPNLAIIDGTTGMFGSHIHGKLKKLNLTIASEDPVACDSIGAKILGHEEVKHIKLACMKGLGDINPEVLKIKID